MNALNIPMPMRAMWLAVLACASGCGRVAGPTPDVPDARPDAPLVPPKTYRGATPETAPVTFGGPSGGINYCFYTITLKQLDVELSILANGQVASGRVQDINTEAVVAPCSLMPIPASVATYDFSSATATSGGQTLIFAGAAGNVPRASLVIDLSAVDAGYSARLTVHRTDQVPPFDWTVVTTLPLAVK